MKVSVLVENEPTPAAGSDPLSGEHGLALLVEYEGQQWLFDTGASDLINRNAVALSLSPVLERVTGIVLSHGHYDHAGGLAACLGTMQGEIPIHVGPGFFSPKVRRKTSIDKPIGVPFSQAELESLGARIIEESGTRSIAPGLLLVNPIPRQHAWETSDPTLCLETSAGEVVPDPFEEEQLLCARTDRGLVVLVGCAHRGLVNSIAAARAATGESRIRAVFGGAHLLQAARERIRDTADFVSALSPERVALGHCTGQAAEKQFARLLGNRFSSLRAGASWTLA